MDYRNKHCSEENNITNSDHVICWHSIAGIGGIGSIAGIVDIAELVALVA